MLRFKVLVFASALLIAGSSAALGAVGDQDAALPKHPIPYRLLNARHRPKPSPAHAAITPPSSSTALTSPSGRPPPKVPPVNAQNRAAGTPPKPAAKPALAPVPPPAPAKVKVAPPSETVAPRPPLAAPQASVAAQPPAPLATPAPRIRRAPSGPPLPEAELAAFVDGQVQGALGRGSLAGVVVSVVQNGRIILLKGYGRAGPHRPMDAVHTRVRLGTASKILTRLEALRQADAGRFKLDRPINSILTPDLQIPDEGFAGPVLLRHLLTETAGFEDRALARRYRLDPGAIIPLADALRRVRPRRVRPAGAGAVPSVYGAALVGEATSIAAGRPFEDLLESDLFAKLGMARTSFREPRPWAQDLPGPLSAGAAADLAEGYTQGPGGLTAQPYAYGGALAPALAATTTAQDMARLSLSLLGGGAEGGPPPFGARIADPLVAKVWKGPGDLPGASAIFPAVRLPGGRHGLATYGQAPGFVASLVLAPDLGLGVFVAGNGDDLDLAQSLAPAIVNRFFGGDDIVAGAAPGPAADAILLSTERAYHGLEAFVDGLRLREAVETNADGSKVEIRALGRSKSYDHTGEGLYRSADGSALYLPVTAGRAEGYVRDGGRGAGEPTGVLHSLTFLSGVALVATLAAVANIWSALGRLRTEPRETPSQTLASGIALGAAVAWLAALGLGAVFLKGGLDDARLLRDWPNQSLVAASWLALCAAVLSVLGVIQSPRVWRDGRRIHGWAVARKVGHALTLAVFVGFAVVLMAWGGLEPWSS